jgi:acid phosphatase (class A)
MPGSGALKRDEEAAEAAVAFVDGPRWSMAKQDAELKLPQTPQAFSCALGIKLEASNAPRLMTLLSRSAGDLAYSSYPAKNRYRRPRPFMGNGRASCTPEREPLLRSDGSYPSGHAAIGWGWALILSELVPQRSDLILARGRAFANSRVICNVHWQSDVDEGLILGAATVAKLHSKAEFHQDLEAARSELAALRSAAANTANCAVEANFTPSDGPTTAK